ncbi:hypothetical protein HanIR_Chr06g0256711 [Helianthus annuus]|nr:hypothetical protein HanIR_Chr06g0256711 [Helianthus annuus]
MYDKNQKQHVQPSLETNLENQPTTKKPIRQKQSTTKNYELPIKNYQKINVVG